MIEKGSIWISINLNKGEKQFKVIDVDYRWGLVSVEIINDLDQEETNGLIQDIPIDTLFKYYTPYGEHVSDKNNF